VLTPWAVNNRLHFAKVLCKTCQPHPHSRGQLRTTGKQHRANDRHRYRWDEQRIRVRLSSHVPARPPRYAAERSMEDHDSDCGGWLFRSPVCYSTCVNPLYVLLRKLSSEIVRQFFIIQVARDLHLIFPSSSATAITIRGMHLAADGGSTARRKMRALIQAFSFACVVRVMSQYAIGILWVRVKPAGVLLICR
jgi:hypothetical protein